MSSDANVIRLPELNKLDAHELTEELGGAVQFEEEVLTTDKAGEPATLAAIVVLSAFALKAISMWILRTSEKGEADFTFESKGADGSYSKKTARLRFASTSPPPAAVIEQIGAAFAVDKSMIDEAKKLAG